MTLSKLCLTPLLLAAFALPAQAAECVDSAMIKEGMAVLGSYSEVPSSIDCATAQSPGEKLICTTETLAQMAVIDDRAWIFAYEATAETVVANPPLDDTWICQARCLHGRGLCLRSAQGAYRHQFGRSFTLHC